MMQTSPCVRSAQDGVNDALWARANQLDGPDLGPHLLEMSLA